MRRRQRATRTARGDTPSGVADGQPLIDPRALEALAAVIPGDVRASGEPALRDGGAEFMASLAG